MSDGDVVIVKLSTVRVCPIVMESSQRNRQPLALPRAFPGSCWTSAYFLFLLFLVLHVIDLLQQQS